MAKRKPLGASQKAKVAIAAIKDQKTVAELSRTTLRLDLDPESDQGVRQAGQDFEKRDAPRDASQFCDGPFRSRRRHPDDQSTVGTRQLCHDDDLPARPKTAPAIDPQSRRLATGKTTSRLATRRERTGKTSDAQSLTLVEILRLGAARITDGSTCAQVASVLAKLTVCRTHVMGGRKYQCADCNEVRTRYNSCGDRHCPGCSGSKRLDFNTRASKQLLPGVVYYQVVFTLPSELSELALANRQVMADLLNDSAWQSLSKHIKSEQAYEPAGIAVLHTWNQRLDAHWHVHLLVPGEGPSLDGAHWKRVESPAEAANSDGFYLVHAERLRTAYRTRAIRRLRHLRRSGQFQLGGKFAYLQSNENWEAFIGNLESTSWVAYIQPPPNRTSRANEVVNYLTRYLTGGPISDARIVAADQDNVTILAREGKKTAGERKQVPVTMTLETFVRSWRLLIQPEQLTKTRYLGGRKKYVPRRLHDPLSRSIRPLGRDRSNPRIATVSGRTATDLGKPNPRLAEPAGLFALRQRPLGIDLGNGQAIMARDLQLRQRELSDMVPRLATRRRSSILERPDR